jgi:hypothetical protein
MCEMLSVLAELQRELSVANTNDGLARGRVDGRRPKLTPDQAALAQQLAQESPELALSRLHETGSRHRPRGQHIHRDQAAHRQHASCRLHWLRRHDPTGPGSLPCRHDLRRARRQRSGDPLADHPTGTGRPVGPAEPTVHKALRRFRATRVVSAGYRTINIEDLARLASIAFAQGDVPAVATRPARRVTTGGGITRKPFLTASPPRALTSVALGGSTGG